MSIVDFGLMVVAILVGSGAIVGFFAWRDSFRAELEPDAGPPPILGGGPDYGDDPRVQARWREWDREAPADS
jgi:hypothetical protein